MSGSSPGTASSASVRICSLSPLRLSYTIKVLIDIAEVLSKPPDGDEPRLSGVGLDIDLDGHG